MMPAYPIRKALSSFHEICPYYYYYVSLPSIWMIGLEYPEPYENDDDIIMGFRAMFTAAMN